MVDHIKAFGKVEETEESNFLAVGGGKDMVGYGEQRGFSGMVGAETVLGRGEKVVTRYRTYRSKAAAAPPSRQALERQD